MYAFVGLGNPGSEYVGTRHNLGFEVVDGLAASLGACFRPGKGSYWEAHAGRGPAEVVLVKPTTYMNNSGEAVVEVVERYGLAPQDLVVLCDDFHLPLGTLRLRRSGSDGGHNGLVSIIYCLQSTAFPRLRCGIASETMPSGKSELTRFVLDRFPETERPAVTDMVHRAILACRSIMERGIDNTLSTYTAAPISQG
jgi:PTH1 family peptidyl-tRNA hydrolase